MLPAESPLIDELKAQLADYFAGNRTVFDLPIDYPGTDFQRRVWEGLLKIPYGETRSYAQLAAEIGRITSYNVCYTKLLRWNGSWLSRSVRQ